MNIGEKWIVHGCICLLQLVADAFICLDLGQGQINKQKKKVETSREEEDVWIIGSLVNNGYC